MSTSLHTLAKLCGNNSHFQPSQQGLHGAFKSSLKQTTTRTLNIILDGLGATAIPKESTTTHHQAYPHPHLTLLLRLSQRLTTRSIQLTRHSRNLSSARIVVLSFNILNWAFMVQVFAHLHGHLLAPVNLASRIRLHLLIFKQMVPSSTQYLHKLPAGLLQSWITSSLQLPRASCIGRVLRQLLKDSFLV